MTMLIKTLAAVAAGAVIATSAFGQSARDIRGPTPLVAIPNEAPAKLIVGPPIPEQLALERVFIQVVGNPIIMKEMVKTVPEAASYAPITILVDERADGVHLSYDSMASLIGPTGVRQLSRSPGISTRRSSVCSRRRRGDRQRMKKHQTRSGTPGELHELGLAAAARAIRNGEVSSETDVGKLLERTRQHQSI